MRIQTLAASLLSLFLLFAVIDRRSVATAGHFDWSSVAFEETEVANTQTDTPDATQNKRDNRFGRALSAPFRAIGRLFGGSKKNGQEARRSIEKDRPKFESTKVLRIKDARTPLEMPADSTTLVSDNALNTYLRRGRELLVNGDFNAALSELTLAASLDPKSAEAMNLLGVAYEGKGLRERALQSFKAAVQADKNNAEYLNNYGFLLFKNNDFEEATKYLKRAAKLSPNDARIWNNLGLAQCRRGKFDDAFESFVRAVGEFNGHINVAAQLMAHGYAKEATNHLEKAQQMEPNSADVLARLVRVYEMTGRVSDAETARRSIIALQTSADAKK